MKHVWSMTGRIEFSYNNSVVSNFASTTQPGTQSDDILVRWPAKPPFHLFSFNILTKVDYNKGKLSAPKPDTKTP